MSHTPGPWRTGKRPIASASVILGPADVIIGWSTFAAEGIESGFDNARLMAAAPDLLEALRVLVDLVEYDASFNDPAGEPDSYAARISAKEAIAKAEGKL